MITAGSTDPTLIVNRYGLARVSYTDRYGHRHHVLAWGAINARTPSLSVRQYAFKLDYSGGYGSFGTGYWARMHNACTRYTGPPLSHLVFACTASDGSYWAIQAWRRELRDGGWTGTWRQQALELHLSHWRGPLPHLFGDTRWLNSGKYDEVFGYLSYGGAGVYGFSSTPGGSPLDTYGRNVYIDTLNPRWGHPGWYRFNSGLTHRSAGNFCLGMYALYGRTYSANGDAYRLTVMGPGVTPIVQWEGRSPGTYNATTEQAKFRELTSFTPLGDPCRTA